MSDTSSNNSPWNKLQKFKGEKSQLCPRCGERCQPMHLSAHIAARGSREIRSRFSRNLSEGIILIYS